MTPGAEPKRPMTWGDYVSRAAQLADVKAKLAAAEVREQQLRAVVEAAQARQAIRGPLAETIRERAAAEQALDDALAAWVAQDEGAA